MSDNRPLSEQWRLAALDWVEKDAAAKLLEESKSAVLARRMANLGDVPVSHAEREVRASQSWWDYIEHMCDARKEAEAAWVQVEYLKMKSMEWQAHEANKRAEMRL